MSLTSIIGVCQALDVYCNRQIKRVNKEELGCLWISLGYKRNTQEDLSWCKHVTSHNMNAIYLPINNR